MKAHRQLLWICALIGGSVVSAAAAKAEGSAGPSAANDDDGGTSAAPARIACDGSLCDTTNDSTCSAVVVGKARTATTNSLALISACCFGLALMRVRSRRKRIDRWTTSIMFGVSTGITSVASADAPTQVTADSDREPVVDVAIAEVKPVHRVLAIEWNPLSLLGLQTLSFSGVLVPADHHAMVVSPFYADTTTVPISVYDDRGQERILPKQDFRGYGAELGYRYYFGVGGPRGLFVGPSLIIAHVTARAMNGTKTSYADLGIAADVGWQALVADRVALGLGLGLQVIETSPAIPRQQFPARVYADRGVLPRFLCSLGWAF